jgi:serine/threonine protein kinase
MFGVNVNRVSHDGILRTAQNRTSPDTKLDCFPLQDQMKAETVAFGYRARAYWALVMPRADESLRDHLLNAGSALSPTDAIAILIDIASALLVELDGKVVHRDLKPENVLFLDGAWRLSDFGISRYAEATTARDTQKYAMSAPYAAPERWRAERATGATDVYSLGVIAFEMLSGTRPFRGTKFRGLSGTASAC